MATRKERLEKFIKNDLANTLIEQANKAAICDSKCMQEKGKQGLKARYDSAQKDLESAPLNLISARRNYFVYAFGQEYYDDFREKKIQKMVDELGDKLKANHNEFMKVINNNIDSYTTSSIYLKNMLEMQEKYSADINKVEMNTVKQDNEYNLNTRRVNYEDDEIMRMKFWLYVSTICYFVCLVIFIFMFLGMKLYSDKINFTAFSLAIIFPFVVPFSLQIIYGVSDYIGEKKFNNNVYLNGSTM